MKKNLLILLATVSISTQAQNLNIKVDVKGIENLEGEMFIGFYTSSKDFMKGHPPYGYKQKVDKDQLIILCKDIPKGEYGISVYQDENSNGKLDQTSLGIPKEPFGFGNDAKAHMGPPKYKNCVIKFDNDTTIVVNLQRFGHSKK